MNAPAPPRIFASPLARRLAAAAGIDLASLRGSGPHGRIVAADIGDAPAKAAAPAAPARETPAVPAAPPAARGPASPMPPGLSDDAIQRMFAPGSFAIEPHTPMRRIIADRLTLAKTTIPHFYLSLDCRLDSLLAARGRMNERAGVKLSVNDFVIKALGLALARVPAANATWTEEGLLMHAHADIAVAVAVEGGLFTPVVRRAEAKTLGAISGEMKELAARARSKRLAPHEYQGGSSSISNLGMFGIRRFDAVINPPHATILAVGTAERRAIVVEEAITIATMLSVTLSCDHRVVDGALGAELLNAFKTFIEDPVTMLV